MPKIELQTQINANPKLVFDLSRSIDLHKISTRHTHEEAIAGRTSGLIEPGETVTWRAKHLGIYQTLTSAITAMESPQFFVDEMVQGAFHSFKHQHLFTPNEKGTLLTDIFEYQSPLGILGTLADWLFLKKYVTQLLVKRNETIKEFAETDQWKKVLSS